VSVREAPQTRQLAIIEATMRCIAAHGYADTTIDRICKEAGISRGLINHHFSTKEELMVKTYNRLAETLLENTRLSVRTLKDDPAAFLKALICASFRPEVFDEAHLAVWLGFWSVAPTTPLIAETHRALYAGYRRGLGRAFERLQKALGEPEDGELAAISITAIIDGFWLERVLDPAAFSRKDAMRGALLAAERFLGPRGAGVLSREI
jgi:AcrR family transcriptional regulator